MEKKLNNEELQSRREFFKKAAKSVLPVIGGVLLSSIPAISKAVETPQGCYGYSCYGSCIGTCKISCTAICNGSCVGYCRGCTGTCLNTCYSTCAGGGYIYQR